MAECAKECDLELDCMAIYRNQNNGYCYMRSTVTGKPVKNAAYGFHRRFCSEKGQYWTNCCILFIPNSFKIYINSYK